MSDTKSIMKFELLPNEILIECFEYLNAFDIFHSFDQLNSRLNNLIRHIPLCIYFQNTNKSIFDEFCTKMIRNPQIKNQIYSLNLPNEDEYLQFKTFLSVFHVEEFPNLQKIESIVPLSIGKSSFVNYALGLIITIELPDELFSKLGRLTMRLYGFLWNTQTSSITALTISGGNLRDFYYLLEDFPMLKYLHTHHIESVYSIDYMDLEISFNGQCNLHLKQLIIDDFSSKFEDLEMFVKQTPNLRSLTISALDTKDMIDGYRWEQIITSSLPCLTIFKFKFTIRNVSQEQNDNIIVKFRQYQTDFWQEQHRWYTEFIVGEKSSSIYTIPYLSHKFGLLSNGKIYCTNERNNINTFINVTNLTLDQEQLTINCEYYFSNVTSLKLCLLNSEPLTIEHIEYLKMIVNPLNLKHLDILNRDIIPISSTVFLEILKQAPQLFSLTIDCSKLKSIVNDIQLCKYLNKMIKKLDINTDHDVFVDDYFEAEQFCRVFSNVEHLRCKIGHGKILLFLLNRLPKLSTLYLEWLALEDHKEYLSPFENEVRQQNIIYDISIMPNFPLYHDEYGRVITPSFISYGITILMWFGKNIL